MPKVSVVVPLYNAQEYVKETVECILNQSFQDFEIIVVNDASTDASVKIVESLQNKDSRIKIYHNKKNRGIAYTRNKAIEYSTGEYIAIMDNDDLSPEYRLKDEVEFLDTHSDFDIVGGHCREIDENGNDLHKSWDMYLNPKYIKAYFLFADAIPNSSAMIRRKFIKDNHIKYRDNMYGAEDYRFWVECSMLGKIASIDKVMLYWRNRKENETSKVLSEHKDKRKLVIREIQQYALQESGFQLTKVDYEIIHKVFEENGVIQNLQEIDDIYNALYKISKQAKDMNLENEAEITTMCRKRFGEKIGKAFFLWK